ncbi:DUF4230 domain-containing protein [Chryseosolibacter indicus]|uniref:DUF4230 domain-containing protein n=1 Tax=Chryseosolibacter indicus TaxID=2782351 RepID=A0ABS5VZW4_9BACT|nr:DUF4230 domain-containing protein [Chryseosolibacter indicus]MBT1705571.1 DUF4230 domain-containing protein [Chryseosolibacter indicus]
MFSNRKALAFVIFLSAICIAAYVLIIYIPATLAKRSYDGAKQIGNDIKNAFQFTPQITVNNTVVLHQQTPILELATVSQTYNHKYEWVNQWMRSTKKITITGNFIAKAGFNLQQKFSIDIDEDRAIITLPQPKILSVESTGNVIFRDENGVWNWVNQDDRSKAVSAFYTDARRYAEQATFVSDAKVKMEDQLRDILKAHAKEVEFRYTEELDKSY